MRVIMFQDRFASLVANGTKRQTIRKTARCKAGDALSLRRWSGKPYRSKQATLGDAVVESVRPVTISDRSVRFGGLHLRDGGMLIEVFARRDGFSGWTEMREWFMATHGLPFSGECIRWSNAEQQPRREAM